MPIDQPLLLPRRPASLVHGAARSGGSGVPEAGGHPPVATAVALPPGGAHGVGAGQSIVALVGRTTAAALAHLVGQAAAVVQLRGETLAEVLGHEAVDEGIETTAR